MGLEFIRPVCCMGRSKELTLREKIIVSAYTGVLMCDFHHVHKYIEEKLKRPILTHELAFESIQSEIEEKVREDFLSLCGND